MITMAKLIDDGYEIKTSTTAVVNGRQEMYVILQRGADAFMCAFCFTGSGWPQFASWKIG